jgi:hypothetical protein
MNSFFGKAIGLTKYEIIEIREINRLRNKSIHEITFNYRLNKIKSYNKLSREIVKLEGTLYCKNINDKCNIIRLLLSIEMLIFEKIKQNPRINIFNPRFYEYFKEIKRYIVKTDIIVEINITNLNFKIDDIIIYFKFREISMNYNEFILNFPNLKQIENKVCYLGEDNVEKLVTLAKKYLE